MEIYHHHFPGMRHTAATLMFAQGVHPKIVQERLGHSSISMTLDTYSHLIPSMQGEIAESTDSIFLFLIKYYNSSMDMNILSRGQILGILSIILSSPFIFDSVIPLIFQKSSKEIFTNIDNWATKTSLSLFNLQLPTQTLNLFLQKLRNFSRWYVKTKLGRFFLWIAAIFIVVVYISLFNESRNWGISNDLIVSISAILMIIMIPFLIVLPFIFYADLKTEEFDSDKLMEIRFKNIISSVMLSGISLIIYMFCLNIRDYLISPEKIIEYFENIGFVNYKLYDLGIETVLFYPAIFFVDIIVNFVFLLILLFSYIFDFTILLPVRYLLYFVSRTTSKNILAFLGFLTAILSITIQ